MVRKVKKDRQDLKEEELLTAVVVLENFSNSFYPLDAVDPSVRKVDGNFTV